MPNRRDTVLDAAVDVLAAGGARGLTHRAVDAAAGVPVGSTSNLFRTRGALVAGVLAHLTEAEQAALAALELPAQLDVAQLTAAVAAMVDDALGRGRQGSLARRALFHEAAADPDVAARLSEATIAWWAVAADLLGRAGVADARARGRLLLACIDGVVADQLARPDPAFDAVTSLAPAVWGIVRYGVPG